MRTLSLLLATALGAPAFAGEIVLHDEDPFIVIARVAPMAGLTPADMEARRVQALLGGAGPALVVGGTSVTCDGSSTTHKAIATLATRAEGSVAYADGAAAIAELGEATHALACLSDGVDPLVAARLHYLLGIVYARANELGKTRAQFDWVFRYQPDFAWDDTFEPRAREVFDQAKAEKPDITVTELVEVRMLPAAPAAYVNGRRVLAGGKLLLPPGPALLQVAATEGGPLSSVQVQVDKGAKGALLVRPALVADEALSWLNDPVKAPDFWKLIGAALPSGFPAYATLGGKVWTGMVGQDGVLLGEVELAPGVLQPEKVEAVAAAGFEDPLVSARADLKQKADKPGAVAWSGIGVLAGGVVLSAVGFSGANKAQGDALAAVDLGDSGAYDTASKRHGTMTALTYTGYALVGVGAATSMTGFVMRVGDGGQARVGLVGPGLGLSLRK